MSPSLPVRPLLETLRKTPLVFDGAMGTQLYERGIVFSACFEELNVTRPDLVARVHEEYVRAGAQVLETNSFGANALRLERHGLSGRVTELNEAAVRVARSAANPSTFVVGAIGPSGYFLGESSTDDLLKVESAFLNQAKALVGASADALLIETMRQPAELRVAVAAALEASQGLVPVIGCVSLDEDARMGDGTSAADIARAMKSWGVSAVGVNCADGPMHVLTAVEAMVPVGLPVLAMPNAGLPRRVDDRLVYVCTPEYFGYYARRFFRVGAMGVGGCCGTTPEHIKRIVSSARMAAADQGVGQEQSGSRDDTPSEVSLLALEGARAPVPREQRSALAAKLGKRFVVSVEVNPPPGLDLTRAIDAARMLKKFGVDAVNIADGPRAQSRMVNLALAQRISTEVGIETILHVCGRDRNLLATVAHLLGAHEFGMRNLVVITGDPPNMGDYPDATAVYDVDSIGILKLASRLNHGIDPAGKSLGGTTQFLLATGVEPAALNYDRELRRLEEKKAAGAELVMTQPVYDPAILDRFLSDIKSLDLPVLVGLLPLASHRNAEFLHNEVPGMQIPDAIRERMRLAGGGASGRKEGVAIAREMLAAVRNKVAGAYVMPPLEKHELAIEVLDGFLEP